MVSDLQISPMVACLPHNGTCLTTSASVLHEGIACDKAASSDAYKDLVDSVASRHPNTKVIPYPFSVAKEDETLALIDELLNTFGRLDIWVCSSGFLGPPSISDTTPDVLQKCFESQSLAPFFALKYAPPAMAKLCAKQSYPNAAPKAQAYGSIVVIASVASTYGGCWGPCHTMMAHASLGVVRAGVSVLKGTGVRINCISAGQIETGVDLKGVCYRFIHKRIRSVYLGEMLEELKVSIIFDAGRHARNECPISSSQSSEQRSEYLTPSVQFDPQSVFMSLTMFCRFNKLLSDWKEQAIHKRLLEWQVFLPVASLHTSLVRI